MYDWDWSVVIRYGSAWLSGIGVTLELTTVVVVIGTVAGVPIGIFLYGKSVSWREVRAIGVVVVDGVRALPVLVMVLIFNYWVSGFLGIANTFWLAAGALSVNLAAFVADIVREALDRFPVPLSEASLSLGLTPRQTLRIVILPIVLRDLLPTFGLLYIDIMKLTSLASVIAVREVTYVATAISAKEFRYLESLAVLSLVYLTLVLPLAIIVRRIARRSWTSEAL